MIFAGLKASMRNIALICQHALLERGDDSGCLWPMSAVSQRMSLLQLRAAPYSIGVSDLARARAIQSVAAATRGHRGLQALDGYTADKCFAGDLMYLQW